MQHSSAPTSRAQKVRQWLLSRRHIRTTDTPHDHAIAHQSLLRGAALALLGYALTRSSLLFSVTPLPAALLIAAPRALLGGLVGVLFGLWQGGPHPSVTLLTLLLGWGMRAYLRLYAYPAGAMHAAERQSYRRALLARIRSILRALWRGTDAPEPPTTAPNTSSVPPLPVSLRTLCAAIGGIGGAVWLCARGGFAYYDLYGAVLLLFLTPLACALFCFALDAKPHTSDALRPLLGQAALLCAVCFCLRSIFFFGVSLSAALLLSLVLFLLPRQGMLRSLGALFLGILVIDLTLLPPLLLCALTYTLLYRVVRQLALPAAISAGLLVTLMQGKTFFWQLAPTFFVSALLLSIQARLPRRIVAAEQRKAPLYQHDTAFSALRTEQARVEQLHARLCGMSGTFGGLCEVLLHMGERLRYCAAPGETPHHTEAFAKDCSIMAGLLQDALSEDARTMQADDANAESLGRALKQEQVSFRHLVYLTGGSRCRIELYDCAASQNSTERERLHRLIEQHSGIALTPPICDESRAEENILTLRSKPRLSVQCTFRSLAAGVSLMSGNTELTKKVPGCGDSVRFFADGQDHFYALLCDGMGSGEEAALTSGVSVLLLERMLRAGVGVDTAMTLLNHYLFSRIGERSETTTTVDLLTIDLYNGKARFIKSGAADTLLLRDEQLYTIGCRTFPLGALSGVDVQVIPFSLQAGDHILMMSDGVADVLQPSAQVSVGAAAQELPAPEEKSNNWLYDMLVAPLPEDSAAVHKLLERILCTARQHGSVDDMTVALLRVQAE